MDAQTRVKHRQGFLHDHEWLQYTQSGKKSWCLNTQTKRKSHWYRQLITTCERWGYVWNGCGRSIEAFPFVSMPAGVGLGWGASWRNSARLKKKRAYVCKFSSLPLEKLVKKIAPVLAEYADKSNTVIHFYFSADLISGFSVQAILPKLDSTDKNSQSLTNRHPFVLILVMSTFKLKNSS